MTFTSRDASFALSSRAPNAPNVRQLASPVFSTA